MKNKDAEFILRWHQDAWGMDKLIEKQLMFLSSCHVPHPTLGTFPCLLKWKHQDWEGFPCFTDKRTGPREAVKECGWVTLLLEGLWCPGEGGNLSFCVRGSRTCWWEAGYEVHLLMLVGGRTQVFWSPLCLWQGSPPWRWPHSVSKGLNKR